MNDACALASAIHHDFGRFAGHVAPVARSDAICIQVSRIQSFGGALELVEFGRRIDAPVRRRDLDIPASVRDQLGPPS